MNNEEKARELSKKFARQYHANNWPECSDDESFHYSNEEIKNACLEMAQWKDEQLSKCLKNLKKEYIRNSGKGLYDNNVIAAKLATLRRIEEEMK